MPVAIPRSTSALVLAALVPAPPLVRLCDGWPKGVAPGDGVRALARRDAATIYVQPPVPPFELAREVGRLFDWQVLTDADRRELQQVMRVPGGQGWRTRGATDGGAAPEELFAECYAAATSPTWPAAGGPRHTAELADRARVERVARVLARIGRRYPLVPYHR